MSADPHKGMIWVQHGWVDNFHTVSFHTGGMGRERGKRGLVFSQCSLLGSGAQQGGFHNPGIQLPPDLQQSTAEVSSAQQLITGSPW